MRFNELDQPSVGDIVEIEIGDQVVEAVITGFNGDEIICETDNLTGAQVLIESQQQSAEILESAPPGMEDWIKHRKADFKKRYGDRWQEVLYATAWKRKKNESLEEELVSEKMHKDHKKAIKGMHQLSGDQFYGIYKFGTTVAGHDGEKQTGKDTDDEISDKPFAYAYTDAEEKMIKAADPDAKQITSNKSEEADDVNEAEYQGHQVKLGKPMQGDVKKFKVYVRNPKTGKTVKVNFGDPNMRIHKSNPKRRKSFRARHHCNNPGPRTKARYWSCRKW